MSPLSPLSDGEFTSAVEILRQFVSDLGGGKSLTAVVKELQNYNRDLLPNLRRVEEKTFSYNSRRSVDKAV